MADLVPGVLAGDVRQLALASLSNRLSALDASKLMVYLIDLVGTDLLPILAEQFHVLGHEGWKAADTDSAQRELIKSAIEMHRRKGTPWALKQSLLPLGFNAEIIDRYAQRQAYAAIGGLLINGTFKLDASRKIKPLDVYTGLPQIQHWAEFIVRINLSEAATPSAFSLMRRLVDEWKPVRSRAIFIFWLGALLQVAIRAGLTTVLQKQSGIRYPWPGRAVSNQVGAMWRLGRDGVPVRLPQAMGGFRVGALTGAKSSWHLSAQQIMSSLGMAKAISTQAWSAGSIIAELDMGALKTVQTGSPAVIEATCRDAYEAEFTAPRVRLTRSISLNHWRRIDGSWRVGSMVRSRAFGFRMGRDRSVIVESVGSLAINCALRAHPERLPSASAQLYLNGRWQLGAAASPAFSLNIIKG